MSRARPLVTAVLVAAFAACSTPVAVGSMVVGTGGLVTAKVMYKHGCDTEGCVYGNLIAALIGTIGAGFLLGGTIGIAVETNRN